MSSIVSYIEQICKDKNIDIPALIQLRAAKTNNDYESIQRISKNILEFLNSQEENKKTYKV